MWFFSKMCVSKTRLDDKTVVITGASGGIGKETARDLYARVVDIDFDDINLERFYAPFRSYAQSKLANILFTKELARRLKEANIHRINIYSLHPGMIPTEISRHSNLTSFPGAAFFSNICKKLFFKNAEQGAQTTIYCSVDEKIANETSLYYSDCSVATTYRKANNRQYAEKLWNLSCRLLHLEPEEDFTTFLQTVSRQML